MRQMLHTPYAVLIGMIRIAVTSGLTSDARSFMLLTKKREGMRS